MSKIIHAVYIFRGMGVGKVLSSKSDLKSHSRSPVMAPFVRFPVNLPLQSSLSCTAIDIISYIPKFKDVT